MQSWLEDVAAVNDTGSNEDGSRFVTNALRKHDAIVVFNDSSDRVASWINKLAGSLKVYSITEVSAPQL